MKKIYTIILFLIVFTKSYSQYYISEFTQSDCGTWVAKPYFYTEWVTIDTLKKDKIKSTLRDWVTDDLKMKIQYMSTLQYSPCGNGAPLIWEQKRICRITGIIQIRQKVIEYFYIEKKKSIYQRMADSIKVIKPNNIVSE